jgi:2-polyprenyl-3-methyl-5-hydroxy-6-metoxy-1,4-benzoquinol methylase
MNRKRAPASPQPSARDYNKEFQDNERRYAYDFDHVLRRYMMRALRPFFAQGGALELGCFEGEMTALLLEEFADVTVVEAASELVERARARVQDKARFVCGRFEDVELQRRFENVFLVHTLEHLDEPVETLRRIRSWITPTGRLFVVVPNANAPSRRIAVKMGLISHNAAVTPAEREHGHRVTYTLDTLERDARLAGLDVVQRGGVFFKPFANYQFDKLLKSDIISEDYLEGCFALGMEYPDLCASIYLVCGAGRGTSAQP